MGKKNVPIYEIPEPDHVIVICREELPVITTPIVYAWKRLNDYLYVGRSWRGSKRFSSHDIIDKAEMVTHDDSLLVWKTNEIIGLERHLIKEYQPLYNMQHTKNVKKLRTFDKEGNQLCFGCGNIIKQPRSNKLYCTPKCKYIHWNKRNWREKTINFIENVLKEFDSDS